MTLDLDSFKFLMGKLLGDTIAVITCEWNVYEEKSAWANEFEKGSFINASKDGYNK